MLPTLDEAIATIKAGNKEAGRKMLADILQADLENETAWLWLSGVATSDEERRRCLQRVLDINPDNKAAQRGLAKLAQKPPAGQPPTAPVPPAETPAETPPERPPEGPPPAKPKPKGDLSSRLGSLQPPKADVPEQEQAEAETFEMPKSSAEPAVGPAPEEMTEEDIAPIEPAETPPDPENRTELQAEAEILASPSSSDDVVAMLRPEAPEIEAEAASDEAEEEAEPSETETEEKKKSGDVVEFLNSERGLLTIVTGAVVLVLICAACVVFNLVFQPLGILLQPTVAAVLGTDTPTSTFTPVTPSATPTPTSTPSPTLTPTLTPSPPPTPVVADTPTVTPTPTRTPTPDRRSQNALVLGVISGDVISVLVDDTEYLVKYLAIDTPAVNDPELGAEPFGPEALAFNQTLVAGKDVTLEQDVTNTDEAGRLLRYVYVDDIMVNEELVRQGLARVQLTPPNTKYGARLQEAEEAAQAAGIGIWSGQ